MIPEQHCGRDSQMVAGLIPLLTNAFVRSPKSTTITGMVHPPHMAARRAMKIRILS